MNFALITAQRLIDLGINISKFRKNKDNTLILVDLKFAQKIFKSDNDLTTYTYQDLICLFYKNSNWEI